LNLTSERAVVLTCFVDDIAYASTGIKAGALFGEFKIRLTILHLRLFDDADAPMPLPGMAVHKGTHGRADLRSQSGRAEPGKFTGYGLRREGHPCAEADNH